MRADRRAGMGVKELSGAVVALVMLAFGFYYYVDIRAAEGKRTQTIRRVQTIREALEKYMIDCGGALPTQKQGLEALLAKPEKPPVPRGWNGPYLENPGELRDGWGCPIKYYCPGGPVATDPDRLRPCDLASFGRDGQEDGKGLDRDIKSWDRATMKP